MADTEESLRLHARYVPLKDPIDRPNHLCQLLLKHVMVGVQRSHDFSHVGITGDKGAVCKMSLDVGLIAWPDNFGSIAVPQACILVSFVFSDSSPSLANKNRNSHRHVRFEVYT